MTCDRTTQTKTYIPRQSCYGIFLIVVLVAVVVVYEKIDTGRVAQVVWILSYCTTSEEKEAVDTELFITEYL
jgi:hypothetical protein